MKWIRLICVVAACFTIPFSGTNISFAQKSERKQEAVNQSARTQPRIDSPTPDSINLEVELMSQIFTSVIEQLDIDASKRQEMLKIVEVSIPQIVSADRKLQAALTTEQHRQFNANYKLARNASYTEQRAQNYATQQLKLNETKQQEFIAAKQQARHVRIKCHNELASLLTLEQRTQLPLFARKTKPIRMQLQLPNVNSAQDLKRIVELLEKAPNIQLLSVADSSKPISNPLSVVVRNRALAVADLNKLIGEGNEILTGYQIQTTEASSTQKGSSLGN